MNLKRIELKGFKSFADRTEIDFLSGVTCIVGPNGCGKSNLIDAIRWVLGEQRPQALRAKRMEEIIFSGSEHRSPLNFAEVSLIFDNAEGMKLGLKELSIRRVIERSGESGYYINNQAVRLKDVRELIMDSGIGVSGYSLISQGDIENILKDNVYDRRKIFEEASGISLIHAQKSEAERRLLRVNDHLVRLEDIFQEIDQRMEPLSEQARLAEKYVALREEYKLLDLRFAIEDYDRYKDEIATLDSDVNVLRRKVETATEIKEKRIESKNKLDEEILSLESEREAHRETIQLKTEERDDLNIKLRIREEKIRSFQKREIDEKAKREENEKLISSLKMEEEALRTSILELDKEYGSVKENLQAMEEKLQRFSLVQSNYEKRKQELTSEIDRNQAHLIVLEEQAVEREKFINALSHELKDKRIEKRTTEDRIEEKIDDLDELQTSLLHHQEWIEKNHMAIEAYKAELQNVELKKQKNKLEVKSLEDEKERLQARFERDELHAKQFDKSWFKGRMIDLLEREEEYQVSLSAILGSMLQDIVLEKSAKIEDLFKEENDLSVLRNGEPVGDVCENSLLERLTPKNQELLKSVLFNVRYAESLEEALTLKVEERIVTKDGIVLEPSGRIVRSHKYKEIFERKAKLDEIIQKLREKNEAFEALEERNIALNDLVEELTESSEMHKATVDEKTLVIEELREKLTTLKNEKNLFDYQFTQLNQTMEMAENALFDLKKKKEELEAIQESLYEEKKTLEEPKVTEPMEDPEALLDEKLKEARLGEALKQKKDQLDKHVEQISMIVSSENLSNAQLEKERAEIEEEIRSLDQLREDHAKLLVSIRSFDEVLSKLQESLVEKKKELKELEELLFEEKIDQSLTEELIAKEVLLSKATEKQKTISEDLWNKYEFSILQGRDFIKGKTVEGSRSMLKNLRNEMIALEPVNLGAPEEFKELSERHTFLQKQTDDLKAGRRDIEDTIRSLEKRMKEDFKATFDEIRANYKEIFEELFQGGSGDIYLEDEENLLESDIVILAEPPGKKLQHMNLLSGGEKSLTAIALLFSVLKTKPAPFYVLDEIEAALDDVNILRFGRFMETFSKESQFILITHRKGTMEFAQALYGVSMEEKGISCLNSLKLQ
ncbi:chromosome segregation protein SMC [Guggenheimella bovis]